MKKTIQTGRGMISLATLVAIWSVSSVKSLPGLAISPILGDLDKIFPHTSHLEIQMLSSLPSLLIIPCVLLAGKLSENRNKLKILYAGLGIFFASGMLCLVAKSMWLLILFNCLLGIGAGLVIPLTTGLVADYFDGRYRTRQLGISSSISNLTLVLTTALAGWLAMVDWHLPFLVYAIPGIALLLTLRLRHTPQPEKAAVPTPHSAPTPSRTGTSPQSATALRPETISPQATRPPAPATTGGEAERSRKPLYGKGIDAPKLNAVMAVYFFATYTVLAVAFNLPFLMQHYGMSSSASGMMISIFFLAIMLPGFFITQILDRLGRNSVFISFGMITAGLALILLLHREPVIALGSFLVGAGYGILQPIAYDKTVIIARPDKAIFALSLTMAASYLAIVVYPFIMAFFQGIFDDTSASFPFLVNGILTLLVAVAGYRYRHTFTFGADPSKLK